MRPPRKTLQPIGQQLTEQAAAVTPPPTMPATGRVRTQPLPGLIVLPAQLAEGMS